MSKVGHKHSYRAAERFRVGKFWYQVYRCSCGDSYTRPV